MIVTVTGNPALDVTYRTRALRPGEVHRVSEVAERAGGKGINVARVLHALGHPVVAAGLGGGPTGHRLCSELVAEGLRVELVEALPDVRRTLVVHAEDGLTTSLWEPGHAPADPGHAADALERRVRDLLADGARALVVSGSLPSGIDAALPRRLARLAADAGRPAVVDADGEALRLAAAAGCAVLMPNREELARLDGGPVGTLADVVAATGRLRDAGVPAVVTTLGAEGMLACTPGGTWLARPVTPVDGNPTGAGDAAAAAVAARLSTAGLADVDWPALLREAVALSAAAVLRPVAGEVDLDCYRAWRLRVPVERLEAP